jgi:integrase
MIEDMTMRKFAPRTQEGYIRAMRGFSAFLGASPDTASFEDLRRYQLHLVSTGAGAPTINHTTTALRFLFMVTLRRPELVAYLPFVREPRRLPVVLSPEEVARLLNAAPGLKYKAALSIASGAGLRASEIISLKVGDIDSVRMVIRVEQGKGRKDRYVMLSQHLLDLLRAWWKVGRPPGLAVSGAEPGQPTHAASAQPGLSRRSADGRDRQAHYLPSESILSVNASAAISFR